VSASRGTADPILSLLEQIRQRHKQLPITPSQAPVLFPTAVSASASAFPGEPDWPLHRRLEAFGLLPEHAGRVAQQAQHMQAPNPTGASADELATVARFLAAAWRRPPRPTSRATWHVLVGAPGAGKTTCLCKWLAQTVLLAGCPVHVWRLDGATANTAEALSVFAEVFGVPVSRSWPSEPPAAGEVVHFVDLPGINGREPDAIEALSQRLRELPEAQVHLVLNAAYEVPRLLEQVEAFSRLPVADFIFTHLDEETRWGKLWNFVLGTNLAIGFLSAGQNVPGDFQAASAELLLPREWPEFSAR
jgi:flagellar biosynthesis GTPase FlhF